MNYQDVTRYLYSLNLFGGKLGLERIERLLELMGNPQEKFKSILVGGTNGKGSTVVMISSILQEAGFKVGTFTKPHLSSFTERIVVNGKRIPEEDVVRIVEEVRSTIERMKEESNFEHPTFFEVVIAITFRYFEEQKVDFAVLEVGLGGRLDATNVVNPLVSVITNVSLEHTQILGDTVLKIAKEKAGIIKKNGILITATEDDEVFNLFRRICKEKKSKIFRVGRDIEFESLASSITGQEFTINGFNGRYDDLYIPLLGKHQLANAATAVGAIEALRFHGIVIPEETIREGVKWPGRLEIVQKNPFVVLDCAKDPEAMKKLKEAVLDIFNYEKLILVISISSDKDFRSMLNEIIPISDSIIITKHKVMNRGIDPKILAEEVKKFKKEFVIVEDVKDAVRKALNLANEKDMILVTGSLFTVAEARELWFKEVNIRWGRELNEIPKK
jgi:dihydrofolate synthase/folylpolyglutamate synthase